MKNITFQLDRHEHPAYDDITSALSNVTEPHSSVVMSHPFSFLNILPYDLNRYFTYKGSLTTPPCSEVVIWLDFEQPVRLAHDQVRSELNIYWSISSSGTKNEFLLIHPIICLTVARTSLSEPFVSLNTLSDQELTHSFLDIEHIG